jgi:hypothetical protein
MAKCLGEYERFFHCRNQMTKQTPYLAYFTFLLETVQTALTGADVYYWFIEGFANIERLKDSHFTPIDIPIFHGIMAFVVQGYFCYRIWTLNKQSSKLCIVIALVHIQCSLYLNVPDL